MDKRLIAERIASIARSVAGDGVYEIVHVEVAGTKRDLVVRVFIDKDGGVTLDDCSNVSRELEEVLDREDLIPVRYVLEVSSPGIERRLYTVADFERFKGELAKIKTKDEINGQKTFVGPIEMVEGSVITIVDRNAGPISVEFDQIDKANLKIDLSKEFGHK